MKCSPSSTAFSSSFIHNAGHQWGSCAMLSGGIETEKYADSAGKKERDEDGV